MNEIEEAEAAEDEIIVLSPEELGAATSEEREAYFQYLVQTVKRVDEWGELASTHPPTVCK